MARGQVRAVRQRQLDVRRAVGRGHEVGLDDPLAQDGLDAGLAHDLDDAVLEGVGQRLGGEQPVARVDQRDLELRVDHLQLGRHLNAHGACTTQNVRRGKKGN